MRQNWQNETHLCRGGLRVREMVLVPIKSENMEAMVESGWGKMEEQAVKASGRVVRLVGDHA